MSPKGVFEYLLAELSAVLVIPRFARRRRINSSTEISWRILHAGQEPRLLDRRLPHRLVLPQQLPRRAAHHR